MTPTFEFKKNAAMLIIPPGVDDYVQRAMEEDPAIIAGRNVAAAAWDPEKEEMRLIISRLLLLEERSSQGRPPVAATSLKVKLPPFWEKDAAAWFQLAEDEMASQGMTDPKARYRTVLLYMPAHLLERARGILNAASAAVNLF